jgi:hypothetical protein
VVDENDGFHAILAYGYNARGIKLFHSWGKYCNPYGGMTWQYFHALIDQIVGLVILDDSDVTIGKEIYSPCNITSNIPAMISVNGVNIGVSPQKIALVKGTTYVINATADGYIAQSRTVDDSVTEVSFTLEAVVEPQPIVKGWLEVLRDFWKFLIALLRGK